MRWFLKASADSLSLLPEPSHGRVADVELPLRRFATDRAAMPSYGSVADVELPLRRFATDRAAMSTLRDALRCTNAITQTHQLRDEEVIRLVAGQIIAGRLTLVPSTPAPLFPVFFYKGSAQNESKDEPAPEESKTSESKNDSAKVPIEWELLFSDGPAVKGFVSVFEPPEGKPPQELTPDGQGHHKVDDFWRHDAYAVTLRGTVEVSGKLEDADGKPIKDAKVTVEPAYGDAVIATTDGGGAFKVKGFVEEEEFDVFIVAGGVTIEGKLTDEKGAAIAGATLQLLLDGGDTVTVETGGDGSFKVPGRLPGEGFSVEILAVKPGFVAEGKFVDEDGKPVEGAAARLLFDGGLTVAVVSDADGKFQVPGLLPEEGYSMEYLGR
jgi:hypothetical protein